VTEEGESALNTPSPAFEQPIGIQAARTMRFMAQYAF
jgi:hypothetical protein